MTDNELRDRLVAAYDRIGKQSDALTRCAESFGRLLHRAADLEDLLTKCLPVLRFAGPPDLVRRAEALLSSPDVPQPPTSAVLGGERNAPHTPEEGEESDAG